MPNKDWTGPNWKGPKTWKWLWECSSETSTLEGNNWKGRWNWRRKCCRR